MLPPLREGGREGRLGRAGGHKERKGIKIFKDLLRSLKAGGNFPKVHYVFGIIWIR
jgi:hypothetical protein